VALFLRFFTIAFAFLLASLAAGLVVAYGLLAPELGKLGTNPDIWAGFWLVAVMAGLITPFFAFAPAFVVILIAEFFDLRSEIFYALAGGLSGVLGYLLSDPAHWQGAGTVKEFSFELQVIAAAGIVAGFIYWLIAGRRAGAWKAPFGTRA
jgi:hypothetical protein